MEKQKRNVDALDSINISKESAIFRVKRKTEKFSFGRHVDEPSSCPLSGPFYRSFVCLTSEATEKQQFTFITCHDQKLCSKSMSRNVYESDKRSSLLRKYVKIQEKKENNKFAILIGYKILTKRFKEIGNIYFTSLCKGNYSRLMFFYVA
jgi:hypothetical protein